MTGCIVCGKDCWYLGTSGRVKCCHCDPDIPKCHYCETCEEEHMIDKTNCKDEDDD